MIARLLQINNRLLSAVLDDKERNKSALRSMIARFLRPRGTNFLSELTIYFQAARFSYFV